MKTTIDIADPLLEQAKQIALRENSTIKAIVEEGVRLVLARKAAGHRPFRLGPLKTQGGGLQPEFEQAEWSAIRDAVYEGRGA